jgi:predicted ATP-grasp superfamily ATP-dependent carboligase
VQKKLFEFRRSRMKREKTLLILGASARAAAFSALAAGLEPICGDAFADADLRRACPSRATARYPAGLAEIARAAPPAPWIYTGALENQPALIARISQGRLLLGNGSRVLAGVRDPFAVAGALTAAGLSAPALARSSSGLPRDGNWLRKPLRSSGGIGIAPWLPSALNERSEHEHAVKPKHYYQQRITGVSCAAIYVAAGGKSQLLGASEQLLTARTRDAAFRYAGSVGPLQLSGGAADRLRRIGEVLAQSFELVGLFGVDYIDDGRDVWPVEINPRYTASIEILERGLGFSAVGCHVAACLEGELPGAAIASAENRTATLWHAKRIIYASGHGVVDPLTTEALFATAAKDGLLTIADIPNAGAELLPGRPILTLFGQGTSREAALAEIAHASSALAKMLPIE